MRFTLICLAALLALSGIARGQAACTSYPPNGFVPDAATAVAIAKAVGVPLFGAGSIKAKAFTAKLNGGVWTVYGKPTDGVGDEAIIQISKRSGAILASALADVVHLRRRTKGRATAATDPHCTSLRSHSVH